MYATILPLYKTSLEDIFFCYRRVIPKFSRKIGLIFGTSKSLHCKQTFASLEAVNIKVSEF